MTMPPDWARDWVSERYRQGHEWLANVPEEHWRLAVLFCDVLSDAAESRNDIFIVPVRHVTGLDEEGLAICYEGYGELAEAIQLGDDRYFTAHAGLSFHDGQCFLECINSWSTRVCPDGS